MKSLGGDKQKAPEFYSIVIKSLGMTSI